MKAYFSILIMVVLYGCSGASEPYWGWHCESNPGTEKWHCDQRLMQDGKPVAISSVDSALIPSNQELEVAQDSLTGDGAIAGEKEINIASSLEHKTIPKQHVVDNKALVWKLFAEQQQSTWKKSIPNLDGTLKEEKIGKQKKTRLIKMSRPTPVAEQISLPDFESQQTAKQSQKVVKALEIDSGKVKKEKIKKQSLEIQKIESIEIKSSSQTKTAINKNKAGFTLQLAALPRISDIERFVEENRIQNLPLEKRTIYGKNKTWSVLLLGSYRSIVEAQQAGDELVVQYPQLTYWVRSLQSILKLEQKIEVVLTSDIIES